jgi:hypothetical protein
MSVSKEEFLKSAVRCFEFGEHNDANHNAVVAILGHDNGTTSTALNANDEPGIRTLSPHLKLVWLITTFIILKPPPCRLKADQSWKATK